MATPTFLTSSSTADPSDPSPSPATVPPSHLSTPRRPRSIKLPDPSPGLVAYYSEISRAIATPHAPPRCKRKASDAEDGPEVDLVSPTPAGKKSKASRFWHFSFSADAVDPAFDTPPFAPFVLPAESTGTANASAGTVPGGADDAAEQDGLADDSPMAVSADVQAPSPPSAVAKQPRSNVLSRQRTW
ncbi:hypothetical protein K488DRAFT_83795 [Vararia minispora EC-137]|uniref:Uncharacterized protein n=1 Tax=Vararia minispora EC-137 TaxID=1314806 RepID=A0ACB8QTB1_9AGAM|nr:hypothetical protein K488DRAFT_83795 [Vararia minispora EC-137]